MNVLVSSGLDDGGETLLGNTHESVGVGSGFHSVNRNTDTSVRTYAEYKISEMNRTRIDKFAHRS